MSREQNLLEYQETVNHVADAVAEELRDEFRSELEPFDAYAMRIRSEFHVDLEEFRKRIFRGYQAIYEELKDMEA